MIADLFVVKKCPEYGKGEKGIFATTIEMFFFIKYSIIFCCLLTFCNIPYYDIKSLFGLHDIRVTGMVDIPKPSVTVFRRVFMSQNLVIKGSGQIIQTEDTPSSDS